jgi:hypothetical protein
MTDEQAGSNTALYVRKRLGAYRKRRVQECILILASAYIDVLSKLNNDVSEAFRLFDEFTKTAAKGQVPTRRRGKARARYAHSRCWRCSTAAQERGCGCGCSGGKTTREVDAARKRYDRLRAERDAHEKWLAEVVPAVLHKLRRPSSQPLFKSTIPAPPRGPLDRDKYSP